MPLAARIPNPHERVLQAYLLGRITLDDALALQRRFVYEAGGARSTGYLILCEHPPTITVGRAGSMAHIRCSAAELRNRRWQVRHVNRGGGCMLHVPGQLVAYSVMALDGLRLNVQQYVDRLGGMLRDLLAGLEVPLDETDSVRVGARRIAHVGIAVRDWVGSFGVAINVHPDLELFRDVECDGDPRPMTSIQRERRLPIRAATVRQRLLEAYAAEFAFDRVSLFHSHPSLSTKAASHAVASGSR